MKHAFLLYCICLFGMTPRLLPAEDLPTYSLVDLVYHAPVIFSAKLIQEPARRINSNSYNGFVQRFLVLELLRGIPNKYVPDTVMVTVDSYNSYYRGFQGIPFDNFIIYGAYEFQEFTQETPLPILSVCLSGLRPFRNDTAFVPFQTDYNYELTPYPNTTFSSWVNKTKRTIARVESVLALRNIQPGAAANAAIFNWIDQHRAALKGERPFVWDFRWDEGDDGWGQLGVDICSWIEPNGIWQDAWKIMEWSQEMAGSGYSYYTPTGEAFGNPEARAFLIRQMTDSTAYRELAFSVLCNSLWNFQHADETLTPEERSTLIRLAKPMLNDINNQLPALYLIETCVFTLQRSGERPQDATLLPELKQLHAETHEGNFRQQLSAFIARMEKL